MKLPFIKLYISMMEKDPINATIILNIEDCFTSLFVKYMHPIIIEINNPKIKYDMTFAIFFSLLLMKYISSIIICR